MHKDSFDKIIKRLRDKRGARTLFTPTSSTDVNMDIDSQYSAAVTVQSYGAKPIIDGVEIIQLPWNSDDGGNFSELYRMENGFIQGLKTPFEAKQISMSVITPGAIKAYHLHYKQDDLWYVSPYDRLLVNMHDVRANSPTRDAHLQIVLGAGKNLLLRIPAGVAHGVANVYQQNMTLFYATSQTFNLQNPDEQRLPWDIFGEDVWEITKG
jgi:dTDP-4-dehydrorhamnose 3,5-epimerase